MNRRLPLAHVHQSASALPSSPASHERLKPPGHQHRAIHVPINGANQRGHKTTSGIHHFHVRSSVVSSPWTIPFHAGTLRTFVCFKPTARAVTWFFKLQEKTRSLLSSDMQVLSGVAIANCRNRINSRRRPGRKWRKVRTRFYNGKQKDNGMWLATKAAHRRELPRQSRVLKGK